jgi:hypothetical protein
LYFLTNCDLEMWRPDNSSLIWSTWLVFALTCNLVLSGRKQNHCCLSEILLVYILYWTLTSHHLYRICYVRMNSLSPNPCTSVIHCDKLSLFHHYKSDLGHCYYLMIRMQTPRLTLTLPQITYLW